VRVAKHENFEEALAKWIRQLNAKDGTAADKITEGRIKEIFLSTVNTSVLKFLLTCYCW